MILLTTTTSKLTVSTSSTSQLDTHASFVDNITTPAGGVANASRTTVGTFDLVPSPSAGQLPRNIQFFSVTNAGVASQTVTIAHTDGTTSVVLLSAITLLPGERLSWMYGEGLKVFDATGAVKNTTVGSGRWLRRVVISATGTYTPGVDTKNIKLQMVGGGGAGGGSATAATSASAGGGGGAGAYLEKYAAVTGGSNYAATIGAAGASASGAVGGNGGATSMVIGATTYTAPGGTGGSLMAAAATVVTGLGGAGGAIATNGDINSGGTPGDGSYRGSAALAQSGAGGPSDFGGGGDARATQGAGSNAKGAGAGGGGGVTLSAGAATAGGNGGAGLIVVDEYS